MNSSIGFVSVSSISIYDRSLALMEQPILPGCLTVRDRGAVTCRSPGPPARSRPPRMAEGDGFLYTFGRLTSCLSATLTIWLSGCSLKPFGNPEAHENANPRRGPARFRRTDPGRSPSSAGRGQQRSTCKRPTVATSGAQVYVDTEGRESHQTKRSSRASVDLRAETG